MSLTPDLHSLAEQDLIDIGNYFDERSDTATRRFNECFWTTVQKLADAPELGERLHSRSPRAKGIRVWQVAGFSNYLIFYRVHEETLQIVRVLHGARNYAEEFDAKQGY